MTNTMNERVLEMLRGVVAGNGTELEIAVANIILDECEESPIDYINQVDNYGCASGIVSALIYYVDTKKFFTEYMDEIFELYNEDLEECGEASFFTELTANNLAWYGFERVCYKFGYMIEELAEDLA